ncbi:MAG: molybdopterin converting factor subunit 1 [Pseudomonadales bacterium]
MLKLVYFASIRERLGLGDEQIEHPEGVSSVADLITWLAQQREAQWGETLADESTLIALNQEMVGRDAALSDGDEVAFFPPVTGG